MAKADLTLEVCIDMCKIEELTTKRLEDINTNEEKNINKIKDQRRKCLFCAGEHEFKKAICPAFGKNCTICNGRNHFAKVCKKREMKNTRTKSRKVNEISENVEYTDETEEESENFKIEKIIDNSVLGGSVNAELCFFINNKWTNIMCELDTGASVCIIGYKNLKNLLNKNELKLKKTVHKLQSFGGTNIPVKGETYLKCLHHDKIYDIKFVIVDFDHGPLLSAKACNILGLVKYCNIIKNEEEDKGSKCPRKEAEAILKQYHDVFIGYGQLPGHVNLEIDNNIKPVIQPARRIPMSLRKDLKIELDKLVEDGIIQKEESHTDWVSNILIVKKKSSFRICLDPIPLNKALKRPHFQFTTIDEILPELGKAKVFTTVDTKKGFWQVNLNEESSKLTTFWTPFGRYRWKRLPFGIASAPEIFQMKMQNLLTGLKGVEILADDIVIYGCGDTETEALRDHNEKLKGLLDRLVENNCKLNLEKLKLCQKEVKFYGHYLTCNGLKPDETKIEAIKEFPRPMDKKGLLRFIGMVTYLSRYIQNLSIEVVNLRKLTHENTEWKWTQVEEEEFKKIKTVVSDLRTLNYYNPQKPIVMECDSSSFGLGVAIYQQEGVIGYASRTLTKSEQNFAQIEKELLSIVFGCVRFDQLLVGNKVTVKTDHKPLLSIFHKPLLKAPKRLQKMLMVLQRYNIELQYVVGKNNIVADCLSRAPLKNYQPTLQETKNSYIFKAFEEVKSVKYLSVTSRRMEIIKDETNRDMTLQKLMKFIVEGWPKNINELPEDIKIYNQYKHEFSIQDGIIYRGDRILIPFNMRKIMTEKVHISHNGVEATLKLAKNNLFWPGMTTEIKNKIKECSICAKYYDSQQKTPMTTHEIPVYPFQYISMDVFMVEYEGKIRKFLVTVDHYSDYFELDILKDLTPKALIKCCKINFSRHGIPARICTDNATNFISQEFKNFCEAWDIQHVTSSPHHKQGNGKAESAVKIAKRLIKKSNDSGEDLWFAILHWRNTPNKINSSPAQRLFTRKTRTGIPSATNNYKPKIIDNVPNEIENNRKNTKYFYDKGSKILPELKIGQPVVVQLNPEISKNWTKGTIKEKLNDTSYIINVNGNQYRRSSVHLKPDYSKDSGTDISEATKPNLAANQNINATEDFEEQTNFEGDRMISEQPELYIEKKNENESRTEREELDITEVNVQRRPARDRRPPQRFTDYVCL